MNYYMKTYNERYNRGMFQKLSLASVRYAGRKEQKNIERNNLIFCTTSCIQSSTQQLCAGDTLANTSIVKQLLKQPFWTMQYPEKVKVIESGRPVPCFKVSLKETGNKTFSSFIINEEIYSSISWICGCKEQKRLYCWPCLLFSKEISEWNAYGFTAFNDLPAAQKEHRAEYNHMFSMKELKLFGKTKYVDLLINNEFKVVTDKYNLLVGQNRKILSELTTVVSILGSVGLDTRSVESITSNTHVHGCNYLKLMNLLKNSNTDVYTHIEGSKSIFSANVINDLIYSISEILLQEIKKELWKTDYVTLTMHEVSTIDIKCSVASIVRYCNSDGHIVERFIDMSPMDSGKNRSTLFAFIVRIINQFGIGEKLIAYNYDCALLRTEDHNHLQIQIQEKYRHAIFVNSYSNNTKTVGDKSCNFNAILIQSLCDIDMVRIFFSLLKLMSNFFVKAAKYFETLDPDVYHVLCKSSTYNSEADFIQALYDNKGKIIDVLTSIIMKPLNWDLEVISNAHNIALCISRFDFNFFLEIFYLVLPATHKLFDIMQSNILYDLPFIQNKITELRQLLHKLRRDFKPIWNMVYEKLHLPSENLFHKISIGTIQEVVDSSKSKTNRVTYKSLYYDIIDSIKLNISVRFNELAKLEYLDLLNSGKFSNYRTSFPEDSWSKLKNNPVAFDYDSLRKELTVIYNDKEMGKDLNPMKLSNYIKNLDLGEIFPETYKLCTVLLTYPLMSISVYDHTRKLVALDRLNEYILSIRNITFNSALLSSNSIFYVERLFLENLRRKYRENFDELVLSVFRNKNHKVDVTYRS